VLPTVASRYLWLCVYLNNICGSFKNSELQKKLNRQAHSSTMADHLLHTYHLPAQPPMVMAPKAKGAEDDASALT
jgi:hypothetical protein